MANLLAIKPLSMLLKEAENEGATGLKRVLGPLNLITLGIGAIIGAGIFVLTGQAAAKHAGPAVVLSFVVAGITCAFAGLCYAEFASLIPIAGSAYTYGYATLGEFVAWIIGWDLVLEYAFGAATVASGWSGYLVGLLQDFHIHLPPSLTTTPGNVLVLFQDRWVPLASIPAGISTAGLPHVTGVFNLVAFLAILAITAVLVIGIEESANLNSAIVIVKLFVVGVFLVLGIGFILHHPDVARANWHPFIPKSQGPGAFGIGGITAGAASIFFAYIGFDAVSTAAQEAKNPQRDMPIGILGSLVICTILYILVSGVLTGLVNYHSLNVADPVAVGIDATGVRWGSILVKIGAVFGLGTVMLVMLLGQSRVFFYPSEVPDSLDFKHRGRIDRRLYAGAAAHRQAERAGKHGNAARVRDCLRGGLDPASAEPAPASAIQDAPGPAGADSWDPERCVPDLDAAVVDQNCGRRLAGGWAGDLLHV
jgi:APA family basic amino acid/polyamine antiporter